MHRVIFVEPAQIGVHVRDILPGRRNQEPHGPEVIGAACEQGLEHIVEAHGVRSGLRDQRKRVLQIDTRRDQGMAARQGPGAIALDRIDLAVMREMAKRLSQTPLRPGIGREALMKEADRRAEIRGLEVGIEHRQIGRHDQPLVRQEPGRETRDIKFAVRGGEPLLAAPMHQIQAGIGKPCIRLRAFEEDLLDARHGLAGLGPQGRRIRGDHPEAQHREALALAFLAQDRPRGVRLVRLRREKEHTDCKPCRKLDALLGGCAAQEILGHLEQEAAAVPALAVGGHRAAMGKTRQRTHRRLDDPRARDAVEMRYEAKTTGIFLKFGPIQALRQSRSRHRLKVGKNRRKKVNEYTARPRLIQ